MKPNHKKVLILNADYSGWSVTDLEDDIEYVVGDGVFPSGDIGEDFRSERLKANLVIFGIFGIIFVGAYITMRSSWRGSAEHSISERIVGVING